MLAEGNKTEKAVGKRIQFKIKMGVGMRMLQTNGSGKFAKRKKCYILTCNNYIWQLLTPSSGNF